MSMVAILPATAFAVLTHPNFCTFEIGKYSSYGSLESDNPPVTVSGLPDGIDWDGEYTTDGKFCGTALPGTKKTYNVKLTDADVTTYAEVYVVAGPQIIVQPDISKRITDGSFTVTPQSKDGNGDVIDVAAVDTALVAQHQPTYTFSSSDPSIATINSTTGEVTLVAEGTTTITVNSAATESYTAADPITFDLTVTPEVSNPPAKKDVPQTDDTTSILPSAVVGIAALGLLILLVNRKKKKA